VPLLMLQQPQRLSEESSPNVPSVQPETKFVKMIFFLNFYFPLVIRNK